MNKFLPLLILVGLLGCANGTDTGNPGFSPANGESSHTLFPESIVAYTCQKLISCNPGLTANDCRFGLYNLSNLDTEFGLQQGEYGTFADVAAAELRGEITPNPSAAAPCVRNIESLSCNDPLVVQAYQPNSPDAFGGVDKIFSSACQDVY